MLPQSLTSLHVKFDCDSRSGIRKGVLPAGLLQLKLEHWSQPLSSTARPASLTELDIRCLCDYPLPSLPPQLQALAIGGEFNQPLEDVLPVSLRG